MGLDSSRVTVRPGIVAPARLPLQLAPPSTLRKMPPFSVPTLMTLPSAGAGSITVIVLPSRFGEIGSQLVPASFVRHMRYEPT
jgi:hypothetical protein